MNVGLVSGGRSVNTIADEAELTVEARALAEDVLERFAKRLAGLDVGPPLRLDVEIIGRRPAGQLDRGSPLLETVRAVREELGLPDALGKGSTDANAALAAGIPGLTSVSRTGRACTRPASASTGSLSLWVPLSSSASSGASSPPRRGTQSLDRGGAAAVRWRPRI